MSQRSYILDVKGVLDPFLCCVKEYCSKILILNVLQIERVIESLSLWKALWIKKVPVTYLKRDPGVCDQNPYQKIL